MPFDLYPTSPLITLPSDTAIKSCKSCGLAKPVEDFYKTNKARCKACLIESAKERSKAYGQERLYRYHRKMRCKQYGITVEQYEAMLAAQDGRCAICCSLPLENEALSIDHCHETLVVRGLLCPDCNHGLGKFKDDVALLEAAIGYLIRPGLYQITPASARSVP